MTRRPGVLAVFLLLAAGCASPIPPIQGADWLEVRTPSFTLVGDLEAERMRGLAQDLAVFDAVVRKVTNTRIGTARVPIRLYVLRDGDQARWLMPEGAAGVIYPTLGGYDSILAADGPDFWTREVLLHEYAHYVLRGDRRGRSLPGWYDEGLSDFLAQTVRRDDVIILGRTSTMRLDAFARWDPLPLDELLGYAGERVNAHRFYSTSWALVHHLNTDAQLRVEAGAYLRRVARGEPWRPSFDASFTPSLPELEESLAEHIAYLQRGGRLDFHLDLAKLELAGDPEVSPVAPAEVACQLGTVLRRSYGEQPDARDLRRARWLFAHAVEIDPQHPAARGGLAWSRAAGGDPQRAMGELGADARRSSDARLVLDAAEIAALRYEEEPSASSQAEARALLERAVALAPERPAPYGALGRHLAAAGARDEAIAAFERARDRGAWSPRLDYLLAREYAAMGERERAIVLLRPLAANLHGEGWMERARELLAKLEGQG